MDIGKRIVIDEKPVSETKPARKKRWWRWPVRVISVVVMIEIVLQAPVYLLPNRLKVSPETTYYTTPLRADGTVDYPAAINSEIGLGVTSENNAAILLAQAMGPGQLLSDDQAKMLDVNYASGQSYFEKWEDWAGRNVPDPDGTRPTQHYPSIQERMRAAISGEKLEVPTDIALMTVYDLVKELNTGRDLPEVRKWLDEMGPLLLLATQASQRERFFIPLSLQEGVPLGDLQPNFRNIREIGQALYVRSVIRVRQGDIEGAFADVLAMRRLANLVAQERLLIPQLVGVAIENLSTTAMTNIGFYGNLSESQALRFAEEFSRLPFAGNWPAALKYKRLVTLDLAREAVNFAKKDGASMADINEMARRVNVWYDVLEGRNKEGVKLPDDPKLSETRKFFLGAGGIATRGMLSREVADVSMVVLIPPLFQIHRLFNESRMACEMAHMALILKAYHAETGGYPDTLELAAQRYHITVPKDMYGNPKDSSIRYKRVGQSYILYSLGMFGDNNEGRNTQYTIRSPE